MSLFRSIGRFLTGSRGRLERVPRFTGQQQAALNQLLQRGMADTDVSGLEQRYRRLYERDTVPGLAQRFTSMGGGQRSSGFQEALRRGGLDLSEQLAGLRYQAGSQALGHGLQPQYDHIQHPGRGGMLGPLLGAGLGLLTGGAGGAAMGALGGMRGMGGGGGGGGAQVIQAQPVPMQQGQPMAAQMEASPDLGGGLGELLQAGLGGLLGQALTGRRQQEEEQRYMPGQPIGVRPYSSQTLMRLIEGL